MASAYPPILQKTVPATPLSNGSIDINFEYPTNFDVNYFRIQYKLVSYDTNTSVNSSLIMPSQSSGQLIITSETGPRVYKNTFNVSIKNCQVGKIYKLQARFFQNLSSNYYSEWSPICYIKITDSPKLSILNENDGNVQTIQSPQFFGLYTNADSSEFLDQYKFILQNNNREVLEDSGWQNNNASTAYNSWVFKYLLEDFTSYYVKYYIKTKNGLTSSAEYSFFTSFEMVEDTMTYELIPVNNYECGCIDLNITSDQELSGNIIIKRSDSNSNYTIWEDIRICQNLNSKLDLNIRDYLVESGISYIYGVQKVNSAGFRGKLTQSESITCYYENIFLLENNNQLTIKFNPKVSSLKRNLLESKQDTIGGQYPFILKNGDTNYFSFSLGGLISYYTNINETFKSLAPEENLRTTNLTDENTYQERVYRTAVEEFLTNGNVKLYKSPTEGLLLIYLMQVSLTPEDKLGKMIYSFTSTAYEVNNISSLSDLYDKNIVSMGEYVATEDMGYEFIYGQYVPEGQLALAAGHDIFADIAAMEYEELLTCIKNLHHLTSVKITIYSNGTTAKNFSITYKPKDSTSDDSTKIDITIGSISYYQLENIVDIYGLTCESNNTYVIIDYEGYASFTEIVQDPDSTTDINELKAVSGLGQIANTFSIMTGTGTLDLFEAIINKYKLAKMYNLTYLKIGVTTATDVIINGTQITLMPNKDYEFRDYQITSFVFTAYAYAQVDFVYNAYQKKGV